MKSLTGLDATFLHLETVEMPMHIGSFSLCALPAGFKGSFHKAVVEHIGKRLHLAPVFSRKPIAYSLAGLAASVASISRSDSRQVNCA